MSALIFSLKNYYNNDEHINRSICKCTAPLQVETCYQDDRSLVVLWCKTCHMLIEQVGQHSFPFSTRLLAKFLVTADHHSNYIVSQGNQLYLVKHKGNVALFEDKCEVS